MRYSRHVQERLANIIDLSAMTVLPGLIDCHTHLTIRHESADILDELKRSPAQCAFESIPNARLKLFSGFTYVREAGSYRALVDVALRNAIARGDVVGPGMLVPGAMITQWCRSNFWTLRGWVFWRVAQPHSRSRALTRRL